MKPGETKRKGPAIKTFDDTRARREAATFDWEDLTVWQQNAVLYGHRLMTELAASAFREAAGREGIRRFLPKMDVERKNNAVLIDGRRGSGKTIVLFTLLRYWIASRFKNILPADHRAEALVQAIDAALDPQRTQTSASEHGPLIVPIGPVDLQYLSPHTQIVPLIAGAFDEVVQGL
ncbi:MAG TPA: hypothetical protein VE010_09130, partial [Thermoanaerobaculia bacterium]|nr:hypothetical protein [Thermoanaerobaculia bacterium]